MRIKIHPVIWIDPPDENHCISEHPDRRECHLVRQGFEFKGKVYCQVYGELINSVSGHQLTVLRHLKCKNEEVIGPKGG